jgi:tetratricopeptide (TPR) repeat protein
MDCFDGIAKGDITLSLLSENTGAEQTKASATWANRVQGAIWRSRKMRRDMTPTTESHRSPQPGSPPRGRSSLPVDVDQARVAGSFRTVQSTEEAALLHLKHDELDEAIELFEDIIFAYYSYFEWSLDMREKNPNAEIGGIGSVDFKLYIGVALHNLGILNLLKGEYREALSFFTRAAENRRAHMGEEHPDHIVSIKWPCEYVFFLALLSRTRLCFVVVFG